MLQSYFKQWVDKYFKGIVLRVVETLNGEKKAPSYLHRSMLRREFSSDGKWESLNAEHTLVAADVVAMDSPLPLKKRDSISKANGKIPKQGMKMYLNEDQLTELDNLALRRETEPQLISKIFNDTPRCIGGVYEIREKMFLEGLSTGVTVVEDSENVGTGVRLNFNYPVDHKFGVSVLWSNPTTAKPFDDINRVLEKAEEEDGNTIVRVMMDPATFNNLAATDQAKELWAFKQGFVGTKIPTPTLEQVNMYTSDRYGWVIEIVKRSVRVEKNGVRTSMKPWASGIVAFLGTEEVGALVWARLAEMNHQAEQVTYAVADENILVSKYHTNDPLTEFTSAQTRSACVITAVDQIYLLDTKTVQA